MPPFRVELNVRDYECDLQGIVNNAEYFHYFEHARHVFCLSARVDFAGLHQRGVDLVVTRAEVDYLVPLRSRDRFLVTAQIERVSVLRWAFVQQMLRQPDDAVAATGRFLVTSLANGRPRVDVEVEAAFEALASGSSFAADGETKPGAVASPGPPNRQ